MTRLTVLLLLIPVLLFSIGIISAEDDIPVFTNQDLEKYGAEPEQELKERPIQPLYEIPFGTKPGERHKTTYRETASKAGLSPAIANMKLGYYIYPEEREDTISGISIKEFCRKTSKTYEKGMKCHPASPDPIIEIDITMGELCRFLVDGENQCFMNEPYKVAIGPSNSKPTMYYIFEKVDSYLVLDKTLDSNLELLREGASAGFYIRELYSIYFPD